MQVIREQFSGASVCGRSRAGSIIKPVPNHIDSNQTAKVCDPLLNSVDLKLLPTNVCEFNISRVSNIRIKDLNVAHLNVQNASSLSYIPSHFQQYNADVISFCETGRAEKNLKKIVLKKYCTYETRRKMGTKGGMCQS